MHRLIALWLLCIGSAAAAQTRVPAAAAAPAPWTRPFLWRIEGAAPSYLFGTMHLPDERAAHFPPSVAQALESSQAVVLEI
jgi:uncharacterized protein YbaP (TraB family)